MTGALRNALVLPLVASIGVGVTLALVQPSGDELLVAAIAFACALPLALRVVARRFDLLEPIVPISVALAVMYVAQPSALLATGRGLVFKQHDYSSKFGPALVVVLVAVVALQLGYAAPWGRKAAARMRPVRFVWDAPVTVAFAFGLALVAFLLFSVFLAQGGGLSFLADLLRGRSADQLAIFKSSSAYFYRAPVLLWPASLLLFAMGLQCRRRDWLVVSFLVLVPLALLMGGHGDRVIFVPLVCTPLIYWWLARGKRPGPLVVLVIAYLMLTVGIAFVRETRAQGDVAGSRTYELKQSVLHPARELNALLVDGTDNDMFVSLASELLVVPSRIHPSPLDFGYRVLAHPVPHMLWPGKPLGPEEELTTALYPWETARASSSSGVIGSFYLAGGLPGVAAGMLLLGWLFRLPWEYMRRFPGSALPRMLATVTLMFVPIALRGGIEETIVIAFFGFVPLLAAVRICLVPARGPLLAEVAV